MGIDSALLDLTERICHKIQLLTGRTNVWIAFQLTNLSVIVYFVWVALYFPYLPPYLRIPAALSCGGVLFALSQSVFKVSVDASEDNAYRRVAKGLRNPRRVRDAPLRLAFLTLSIALVFPLLFVFVTLRTPIAILGYLLVGLTAVVLYLLACDPLPPCRGRLADLTRALRPRRVRPKQPVPVEVKEASGVDRSTAGANGMALGAGCVALHPGSGHLVAEPVFQYPVAWIETR